MSLVPASAALTTKPSCAAFMPGISDAMMSFQTGGEHDDRSREARRYSWACGTHSTPLQPTQRSPILLARFAFGEVEHGCCKPPGFRLSLALAPRVIGLLV